MAALLLGCGREPSIALSSWQLVAEDGPPRAISLPVHFDRELPPIAQRYVLRTSVAVPAALRGRTIALVVPRLCAKVEARAAGIPLATDSLSWFTVYRRAGPHAFWIPPDATRLPRLELELEVRHVWTQSAWLDTVPYLTSAPHGGLRYTVIRTVSKSSNLVSAGVIITAMVANGIIFLFDRRRRPHGWFAVQCAFAMVYPVFEAGFTQVLSFYDTSAMVISLDIAIFAGAQFTRAQLDLPPLALNWLWGAVATGAVSIVASGPFLSTYWVIRTGVAVLVVGLAYVAFVAARMSLVANPRPSARPLFAAWVLLIVLCIPDIIAWLGFGELLGGARIGAMGIACFVLVESVLLAGDFVGSVRKSESLSAQLLGQVNSLAEQRAAVAHLNDELRRQVLARSEQLSDALTRLAGAQGESVVFQEGEVVEDRYRVVRAIGAGGMGVVYEVRRMSDGARLALKVLLGTTGIRELARFAREGKLAATVNHPNVVRIYDTAISQAGVLFLVLEYVDGEPVSRRRERYGDTAWVLAVLEGVARGLAAVHEKGIVHRDLKPANVLVCDDAKGLPREVKLTDFGISNSAVTAAGSAGQSGAPESYPASDPPPDTVDDPPGHEPARSADRQAKPLTQTGLVLGTPVYTAPEAVLDPRQAMTSADIYSLGVMAFEMLFGRRPFTEIEAMERMYGLTESHLPSMRECKIPEAVASRLDAALDLDPAKRPTAAELADLLAGASRPRS